MTGLEQAYETVFTAALVFLGVMLLLCLIRAVRGPRVADRLVAVNMMGTMVMVMIAILALLMKEGYLVDICIIYAMISFLAVIVLTKVYMGVYRERKDREKRKVRRKRLMNLEILRFIIGTIVLIIGLLTFALEVFGSYRYEFVLNRMHAAALGDTLGIGISLTGLIIFSGLNFTSLKMLLVIVFYGLRLRFLLI